jgi:erythromycin esterase
MSTLGRRARGEIEDSLLEAVRARMRPIAGESDLEPLLDEIGDARIVMLGEASHGTSEFYLWRSRITQKLIQRHGFSFVAVALHPLRTRPADLQEPETYPWGF